MKVMFDVVECVTSGRGFEEGNLYAQVGWNNGIHILRESEHGDCIDEEFMSGGIGKGLYNPWDNTGAPSFSPIAGEYAGYRSDE